MSKVAIAIGPGAGYEGGRILREGGWRGWRGEQDGEIFGKGVRRNWINLPSTFHIVAE